MADGERREPRGSDGTSTPSVAATVPADRIERQGRRQTAPARVTWDDEPDRAIGRGTAIRRYVVEDVVGAGAMGVVYAAHDRELDRKVALKLVRDRRRGSARHRLLREAQALAQLSHPNVVAVYDVGTYRGQVFLAMEFVSGRTLRSWLAEQPRSRDEILEAYRRAGEGLAAAHAAGIVHRDFKPDNVLVDDRGRVRVADFGLAWIVRGEDDTRSGGTTGRVGPPGSIPSDHPPEATPGSTPEAVREALFEPESGSGRGLTATGAVLGTPAYMAPEQRAGTGPVDARADQFSFCVALYEALCGQRPYEVADTVPAAGRKDAATSPAPAVEPDPGAEATRDLRRGAGSAIEAESPGRTAVAVPRAAPAAETAELAPFAGFVPLPPPPEPPASALGVRRLPVRIRRLLARGLCIQPDDRYPSMSALLADLEAGIPARRHRRQLVAAAAVALGAAALAVALGVRGRSEESPCRGSADRLAGVWDASRARAVRAAFEASGSPLADAAAGRLSRRLDRWSADWVAARTDACEATRVRDEQSAFLLDLRMECLDRRRAEVDSLVDLLSGEVDRGAVAHAVQAAQSLVPLSRCADREALTEAVPTPSEPARRDRAVQLEQRLAAVRAQIAAGRVDVAVTAARQVARDAAALAHRPLEAEAFAALAEAETDAGDLAAAEDAFYRAIAAGEAGRAGRTTASAWIDLADMVGVRDGRREEGRRLARLAQGAVDRLGGEQELGVELEQLLGNLAREAGDAAEARRHLERALALATRLYGPDGYLTAESVQRLAQLEEREGRLEEALRLHRRAHRLLEAQLGPDNPDTIATLSGEGSTLHLAGRLDESLAVSRQGLASSERALGPDNPLAPTFLNNIGMVLREKGDLPGAVAALERALAIDVGLHGPDHLDAAPEYFNLGNSLVGLERFDDAAAAYERAIAIYERVGGPDDPALARALGGLGEVHVEARRPDRALPALERAVSIYDRGPPSPAQSGEIRFLLARALWEARRDRPRALRVAEAARVELDRAGYTDFAAEVGKWIQVRH